MKKKRAKVIQNGGSQAVRLPKEFRFDTAEVIVYRQGCKVVLEPVDEWPDEFRALLGSWTHKIPRPKQRPIKDARDPFAS